MNARTVLYGDFTQWTVEAPGYPAVTVFASNADEALAEAAKLHRLSCLPDGATATARAAREDA